MASVEKRTQNGKVTWLARWRDPDGRQRKRSFPRKIDAQRFMTTVAADVVRGRYLDPDAGKITFRAYAERWRRAQFSDQGTAEQVGIRLRLHVYPVLGHLEMRQLRPSTIRQWLAGLTMARSYQRTIFANVSQVFAAAVADELIGKNPCQSGTIRKPTADPRKVVPWPRDWVDGVIAALPERYRIVAVLGVGLGLRQGEIFGLSPDDVDFLRGTVEIRRQVKLTAGNRPYLALPKGRKTRTLPLPRTVRDALAAHLAWNPAREVTLPWDRSDGAPVTVPLVVTSRESAAMNRNYFNAKIWRSALAAADVPASRDNGCHALRHYYASLLLDGGESIKTVSERLGHSDPGFTLRTYTHLMPSADDRTRSIIDAAFAPTESARALDVP